MKVNTNLVCGTGEEIKIPAGYGVKLTAGSALKKAVAK